MPSIKRALLLLLIITTGLHLTAQPTFETTTFGINGGGSKLAPCTEILRFDNYNDNTAGSATGQDFVFLLNNGDSLYFNLKRTGEGVAAFAAPCWTSAAFGQYGYTGLVGMTVLYGTYNQPNDNVTLDFTNIVLKDRLGNIITDYKMMVFDAESTSPIETTTLTAPAPLVWSFYDSIAPTVAGYTRPNQSGLGTNVVTWSGTFPDNVPKYLNRAVSVPSPPSFSANLYSQTQGIQAIAIGIKKKIVALNDSSCTGGNFTIYPFNAANGTTYTWSLPVISPAGSVTGATAQSTPLDSIKQTLVYNGNTVSTVTYTITPTTCGLPDSPFTATIVLGAGNAPAFNIGIDTAYCGPFTRVLTSGNAATVWSTGSTGSQITVAAPGTYKATVNGTCHSVSDSITLTQNPVPNVYLGPDTALCNGQSLLLDATTNGNVTYKWQDNSTNTTYNVTSPGTYSVTVTSNNNCSAADAVNINYNFPPNPFSLGNDTAYCGAFTRMLSTISPTTIWSTGVTAQQITVGQPGTYWAKQTNGCGTVADTIVLTQNQVPNVYLGPDSILCTGQSLLLNATTNGNVTYQWQDNSTNTTYNVTSAGIYSVTVTNSDNCSASDQVLVSYTSLPPAINLGNDTTYCGNFSRVISTGVANTVWNTGVTAPQITVNTPGVYKATISNGCGPTTDSITIHQNPIPVVNLGNDTTLCAGQTLTLDATNVNCTYSWQDNSTLPTYTVTTAGNYAVTVSSAANCFAQGAIAVNYTTVPAPVNMGNDTAYCGSFTRVLSTGIASTFWSTGVTAAQITVNAPGVYKATQTNSCGSTIDSITIAQNPLPVVNLGNDTTVCAGHQVVLNATNANSTYVWQNQTTNPTFTVSSSGTYTVTVTNAFSCSASSTVAINYDNQQPVFNLGNDTTYCQQFSRVLSTGLTNTLWSDHSTGVQITVNGPGVYWAVATNACGSSADSITLSQSTTPQVSFPGDLIVCPGDTLTLQPATTGSSFLWGNGDITPTIIVTQPGNYTVQTWIDPLCKASATAAVALGAPPVISLGNDTTICGAADIPVALHAANTHYLWQDNTTDSIYHITVSGTYAVTATNACGSSTSQKRVEIYQDECALLIPTGFSPNGDGKNDLFRAISPCPVDKFAIHIYNRWGQLVFESNDITIGWDGTFKGTSQPLDVFVYYAEYYNYCKGGMDKRTGNVTLLR